MKANIVIGKGQLDSLSKEINKMTEKNYSDEISNANSLTDMQLKLDQLKEKQNLIISKFHVVLKNYEKKKELQKEIQEKYNEKQKINHFM